VTIAAQLETAIARSAEAVFAEISAVERYPEWLIASGIVRVELLDPGPLADGTKIRIEQRVAGRASTLEGAVSAFEPPTRFGLRAKDRDGISIELEALLSPGGLASRLRWSIRIGLPLRYRMFESMAAPEVKRAAAADLENLRRRLEAVAT
jgi:hypothetical protein